MNNWLVQAQYNVTDYHDTLLNNQTHLDQSYSPSAPLLLDGILSAKYPSLNEYMGLELTRDVIAANMPEYLETSQNVSKAKKKLVSINFT